MNTQPLSGPGAACADSCCGVVMKGIRTRAVATAVAEAKAGMRGVLMMDRGLLLVERYFPVHGKPSRVQSSSAGTFPSACRRDLCTPCPQLLFFPAGLLRPGSYCCAGLRRRTASPERL